MIFKITCSHPPKITLCDHTPRELCGAKIKIFATSVCLLCLIRQIASSEIINKAILLQIKFGVVVILGN